MGPAQPTAVSDGFFLKCMAIFFRQENVNQKYETHSVNSYFTKHMLFFLCEGRPSCNDKIVRSLLLGRDGVLQFCWKNIIHLPNYILFKFQFLFKNKLHWFFYNSSSC